MYVCVSTVFPCGSHTSPGAFAGVPTILTTDIIKVYQPKHKTQINTYTCTCIYTTLYFPHTCISRAELILALAGMAAGGREHSGTALMSLYDHSIPNQNG